MSPPGPLLPRRPARLGELVDATLALVRGSGVQAALTVAIVLGPIHLLAGAWFAALPQLLDPTRLPADGLSAADLELLWVSLAVAGLAGLLGIVLTPLVLGAVVTLMGARDRGRELGWRGGLVTARSRWGALLGATVLTWLLVAVGLLAAALVVAIPAVLLALVTPPLALLVVIPAVPTLAVAAVAAGALTYLVIPPVVMEDRGAIGAVRRAWELLRVRPWPVVGIALLAVVAIGIVSTPVGWLFQLVAVLPGQAGAVAVAAGGLASTAVTIVLGGAVALVVHADLRARLSPAGPSPRQG